MNVGSLLSTNAVRFPAKSALIEGERRVSYSELNRRANKLANKLLSLGLRKGDEACLYFNNSIEFVEIYFALSKIGVIVVPINFKIKGKELYHIVRHSGEVAIREGALPG